MNLSSLNLKIIIAFVYISATLIGGSDESRNNSLTHISGDLSELAKKIGSISEEIRDLTKELKRQSRIRENE